MLLFFVYGILVLQAMPDIILGDCCLKNNTLESVAVLFRK